MPQTQNELTSIGYPVISNEDIRQKAPSVFTLSPAPHVTDRYSHVPTHELLDSFAKLNWTPTHVRQAGTSKFGRHVVRLNNPELGFMKLQNDNVRPQIILDNSHDGKSSARMHLGLFRLVCTNGLVVAMPGMYSAIKLRHVGIELNELKQLLEVTANQYEIIGNHITEMQDYRLNNDQQEEFAIHSMAIRDPRRFINKDGTLDFGKITAVINPKELVQPVRGEDRYGDLWSVFNTVQERLVKGNFESMSLSGRKSKPRVINHAVRHLEFNKGLWELAESYMTEENYIMN